MNKFRIISQFVSSRKTCLELSHYIRIQSMSPSIFKFKILFIFESCLLQDCNNFSKTNGWVCWWQLPFVSILFNIFFGIRNGREINFIKRAHFSNIWLPIVKSRSPMFISKIITFVESNLSTFFKPPKKETRDWFLVHLW